jgi:hypothetical protein
MARFAALEPPASTKLLPNWAVAGILGTFVVGTYYYSMRAVGTGDLAKEVENEYTRQLKQEGQ